MIESLPLFVLDSFALLAYFENEPGGVMVRQLLEQVRDKKAQRELTTRYESFLLRLRWTEQAGEQACYIYLKNITTQQESYFAALEELYAFLGASKRTNEMGESDTPF